MIIVTFLAWVVSTSAAAFEINSATPTEVSTQLQHSPQNNKSQTTEVNPQQEFNNAIDAVIAASNQYNPHSIAEDREYMGAILRKNHTLKHIYTAAAGERGKNRFTTEIIIPEGYSIVAFWHTHGDGDGSRHYFSKTDGELVRQWQMPFYLADSSGYLKVLTPKDRTMTPYYKRDKGVGYARGGAEGNKVKSVSGGFVRVNTRQ